MTLTQRGCFIFEGEHLIAVVGYVCPFCLNVVEPKLGGYTCITPNCRARGPAQYLKKVVANVSEW